VHVQASLAKQIERQDADGGPSGAIVDNTVEIPGDLRDRVRDVLTASPPLHNIESLPRGRQTAMLTST
jgi:translation initiation factor 1 (eIF-1/SUI1)